MKGFWIIWKANKLRQMTNEFVTAVSQPGTDSEDYKDTVLFGTVDILLQSFSLRLPATGRCTEQ